MDKHSTGTDNLRLNFRLQLSFLSLLLYLIISLILLSALNYKVVWHFVLSYSPGADQNSLEPLTTNLVSFMERLNAPVLMLFWAAFGAAVYAIIWFAQNVIFTVGKEVRESRYIKGGARVQNYWQQALASNLALAGIFVVWILYGVLFFRFLLPMACKLFFVAFYEPSTVQQALDVAGATVSTAAGLFVLWTGHKILSSAWRAASI